MIPLVTRGFVSGPGPGDDATAPEVLTELMVHLALDARIDENRIVSLAAFAAPEDVRDLTRALAATVPVMIDAPPPPVTVYAQPPAFGRVALEATWVHPAASEARIERFEHGGSAHALVELGGVRQLHAGGSALLSEDRDPDTQADEALAAAAGVLAAVGMDFGHVVRQWNTIGRMLAVEPDGRQRYQIFNDARTKAYGPCTFVHGYPAATGIGQAADRTQVELLAVDGPGLARERRSNPEQVDAHCYSAAVLPGAEDPELHAKTPPKFERAVELTSPAGSTVLVSGTASIVGEVSAGVGDVVAQTRITLRHIETLLGGEAPTHLRVYVKRSADVDAVAAVCREVHAGVPATYVIADVCRDELLVEIEAAARVDR